MLWHHECDQDPVGSDPSREPRRAGLRLGGDGMDGMAPRLPAPAGSAVVRVVRMARLPAAPTSSGGGSPSTPMRPTSLTKADTSRRLAESPPSPWPRPCRSCAPGRPSGSRPTGRRDGRRPGRFARPGFSATMASFLAAGAATTCAMTAPSMSCALPRPAAARASGLVVPTLLTWPGSAIVHDIKGENWTLTAGWRARFGRVLLFDPTNAQSAAYNPLLEVRRGEWEVRDVQNIADVLVDPEGALEKRNHWEKTSHALAGRHHPACALRRAGQDAWPASPISSPIRGGRSRPHCGR